MRNSLADLAPALQQRIDRKPLHDWVESSLRGVTRYDGTLFRVSDERECVRLAWEILAMLPGTGPHFHGLLAQLHSPSHVAFRKWLKEPERAAAAPGLHCLGLPVLPRQESGPGRTDDAADFWRNRTAVHREPGGARYVKGPHPESMARVHLPDHFPMEGALWNLLYQGEPDVHAAFVQHDGATEKLVYGHRHEELFGQYAADWKPESPAVLTAWNRKLVGRLVRLLNLGYGYRTLTELYHDRRSHRALAPSDFVTIGCIDDLPRSMRYSNLRAGGWLADLAREHMSVYGAARTPGPNEDRGGPRVWGPTQRELAELLVVQASQLALASGWTAREQKWSAAELALVLRELGGDWARALELPPLRFEDDLPAPLESFAREALFAMNHLQNGIDLGHDNGAVSTPGLFAFAETVARKTVEALAATG